jgi:DNA-binding beta-propeller fold protein YncE
MSRISRLPASAAPARVPSRGSASIRRARLPRWMAASALLGAALCAAAAPRLAPAADAPYKVATRYKIGGDGRWDYLAVDATAHRLFVSRATRVQVVDLETGKVTGEIQDTPGVHGIALAPDLGRGYTSNGGDSTVTVFDLKTLAPVTRIHVGAQNPDAILYEPVTHRVFTFNGGSNSATAIDAAGDSVVGSVALGGRPEYAVADGKGRVYVNLEDSSAVLGFDARTLAPGPRWRLSPGEHPSGLAMDAAHRVLFSGCRNKRLVAMDADSGRVLADLPIGTGVDGVAFDAAKGLVLTSNGEGTVTVIQADAGGKFKVLGNVPTQRTARTLALDPSSGRVYLAAAEMTSPLAPPSKENPWPRGSVAPGSFSIIVLERQP